MPRNGASSGGRVIGSRTQSARFYSRFCSGPVAAASGADTRLPQSGGGNHASARSRSIDFQGA